MDPPERFSSIPPQHLRAALDCFALTTDRVEPLFGGAVNTHWKVKAGDRLYALRRYNLRHDPAGIPYEHALLAHLAARGWPVAAPLPCRNGRTLVEVEGQRFALFPFLPGHPVRGGNPHILYEKGRSLALLHREMAAFPIPGQRPGFARVTDLDTWIAPDRFATVDDLLDWLARTNAPLAWIIRREREESTDELRRRGFARVPDALVHFEFYGGNLLFAGGRLAAVLDFDFVHLDAVVSDLGRSIVADCTEDGGIDAAKLTAFLSGYLHVTRLQEDELRLVVPLLRANLLWMAVLPLSLWAAGDPAPYLLPSATHTATVGLPALRSRRDGLESAVRAAADTNAGANAH